MAPLRAQGLSAGRGGKRVADRSRNGGMWRARRPRLTGLAAFAPTSARSQGARQRDQPPVNHIRSTSVNHRDAAWRPVPVIAWVPHGAPKRRRSSLTVVRFGSSRGDGDGDGARFGCEEVAAAPSRRAGRSRPAARGRNSNSAQREQGANAGPGCRNAGPGYRERSAPAESCKAARRLCRAFAAPASQHPLAAINRGRPESSLPPRASVRRRSTAVRPLSVRAKPAMIPRTTDVARSPRSLRPRPQARPPAHRHSRKRPSPRYRRTHGPRRRRSPGQRNRRRRPRSIRSEPQHGRVRHCRRPPSPCR